MDRLQIVLGRAYGKSHGGRKYNNRNQTQNSNYDNRYKIDRTHGNKDEYSNDLDGHDDRGSNAEPNYDTGYHQDRGYYKRQEYKHYNKPNNRFKTRYNKRGNSNLKFAVEQSQRNNYNDDVASSSRYSSGCIPTFKITLCQSKGEPRDELLSKLFEEVGHQFNTGDMKEEKNNTVFYVDDSEVAAKIGACSRKILKADSYRMVILVAKCTKPISEMTKETIDKITAIMSSRYNKDIKVLNLCDFASDAQLKSDGIILSLSRVNIVDIILGVILKHIPEVVGIDLSHNRMFTLNPWRNLLSNAPQLCAINLSHNLLRSVDGLSPLKKLNIVEIKLVGNLFCNSYKSSVSKYTSDVQDIFPKLMKLDDVTVCPTTTFDTGEVIELPPKLPSYLPNTAASHMLLTFVNQFLKFYDSKERDRLFDAYHNEIKFSLSVCIPNSTPRMKNDFLRYMNYSRNLKHNLDDNRRHNCLKTTRSGIMKILQALPRTDHDFGSLIIDVGQVSDKIVNFQLSGIFKEVGLNTSNNYRFFSRLFVLMPRGGGLVIINDALTVTSIPQSMKKDAFTKRPTIFDSIVAAESVPTTPKADEQALNTILQRFIESSGMNADWSTMCLKQNDWNFEKAGEVFLEMKNKGKIPESAYVK